MARLMVTGPSLRAGRAMVILPVSPDEGRAVTLTATGTSLVFQPDHGHASNDLVITFLGMTRTKEPAKLV